MCPAQSNLEEKEKKLAKDLVKGPKDLQVAQEKLRQTRDSKQLAEAEGMCDTCMLLKYCLLPSLQ